MSRYVPPLKRVLEEVLSPAGLSASEYPFAGEAPPMPAVAGGAMGKAKKAVAGGAADGVPATGRRLIVIMLGTPTGPPTPLFAPSLLPLCYCVFERRAYSSPSLCYLRL